MHSDNIPKNKLMHSDNMAFHYSFLDVCSFLLPFVQQHDKQVFQSQSSGRACSIVAAILVPLLHLYPELVPHPPTSSYAIVPVESM